MKDLFILISAVMILFNLSLVLHKIREFANLTKEIKFTNIALEALKVELREDCMVKLRATLIWIIFLGFIIYYF